MSDTVFCQRCSSNRIVTVSGKSDDSCSINLVNTTRYSVGYALTDMNITTEVLGEDYIDFTYCLNCGQIQGEWPLKRCCLEKVRILREVRIKKKG